MLFVLIYFVGVIVAYRFVYPRWVEDPYSTEGEARFFAAAYAVCWPGSVPLHLLWEGFRLISPKSESQKRDELRQQVEEAKRELFRIAVERADLEHEGGFAPLDPPEGWVPKGHPRRYWSVDYKLKSW